MLNIGIIGVGYVGGAMRAWFERYPARYRLFLYDKFKNIGSPEEVNRADIVFVAVPTPFREGDGGYDGSAVEEAASIIKGPKIVVVRSTVLPGTTESFQSRYPDKIYMFNPEFLRAKTAVEDFSKPFRHVIGYTRESRRYAGKILDILPAASRNLVIPATEAELSKYFVNAFLANRVIFANQLYDLCQTIGADYGAVKDALALDPRIGNSHFEVLADGYRGYGGNCLPKDIKTLRDFALRNGARLALIDTLEEINRDLRRRQ